MDTTRAVLLLARAFPGTRVIPQSISINEIHECELCADWNDHGCTRIDERGRYVHQKCLERECARTPPNDTT